MSDLAQPSSKRSCLYTIDRISNLPDAVLCHILCFLPTIDSVRTTILSKRWEALWTQVPDLNFRIYKSSFDKNYPIEKASWYLNFVNNVLSMSKAGSIRNFTLDFWPFRNQGIEEHVFREWIGSAVRRNVQELSLDFWFSRPEVNLPGCLFYCKTLASLKLEDGIFIDVPATVHLPCLRILHLKRLKYANDDCLRRLFSGCPVLEDLNVHASRDRPDINICLFYCKTLVSLELKGGIFVDVPATVHLPCLRILQLNEVIYANDDTLRRLFSGCPVLEDLTILRNSPDNIIVLDINVPSLKKITMKRYKSNYFSQPDCKLLISAPMLERIYLKDLILWDFLTEDVSNLAKASIVVFEKSSNDEHQLFNLLKKMANVRFLSLLQYTMWTVLQSFKAKFPVFQILVYLHIRCSCQHWHALLALLECSDNLKTLKFRSMLSHVDDRCCEALEGSVPKCVSMSLKTLILRGVYNGGCELKLLRYFLKNAKLLEQMKIRVCSSSESIIRKELVKCPMASMACNIRFFH